MICPYYHTNFGCTIYDSIPSDYTKKMYCLGQGGLYIDCPNYRECKRVNGGIMPPPKYS